MSLIPIPVELKDNKECKYVKANYIATPMLFFMCMQDPYYCLDLIKGLFKHQCSLKFKTDMEFSSYALISLP